VKAQTPLLEVNETSPHDVALSPVLLPSLGVLEVCFPGSSEAWGKVLACSVGRRWVNQGLIPGFATIPWYMVEEEGLPDGLQHQTPSRNFPNLPPVLQLE